MRVEEKSFFVGETNNNEKSANKEKGSIFAGELNKNLDPIAGKRQEAREKAMKVVGDAFSNEKKIDDDIQSRRDHVAQLNRDIGTANEELKKIESNKTSLRESYGIEEDSEEQKDLKLLENRRDSMKVGSNIELTEEDKKRLKEIDAVGKTEYQTRSLEMDAHGAPYRVIIEESQKVIIEENAIIRGVKLERLKTHPMIDAAIKADEVLKAASEEIVGMLVDEVKENVDEEIEEKQEEADKKAEEDQIKEEKLDAIKSKSDLAEAIANPGKKDKEFEPKNSNVEIFTEDIIKLDQVKTDVQAEVADIVNKMKLIAEDIKGAAVDSLL